MINKNMKENETCEDCFAGTMEIDAHKGELICSECGIVAASQDLFDGDAGKTTYGGDSATHHGVQTNCDSNDQIGTQGAFMDLRGVPANQRGDWVRRRKVNRSTSRIKHPLSVAVRKKVKEMYGDYASRAVEPYIKMACKPLKGELEEQRSALEGKDKALKKALGMPKQSICRKGKGVRGETSEQNIVLLAMAVVEVAGRLDQLSKMDRRSGMEQHGIKKKQLVSAVKTILNHYRARVRMEWETAPRKKTPGEIREDGVDQAVHHIHDMLGDVLVERDHLELNQDVEARLALLNEGTADALTGNTEVRMAVCVTFYASLVRLGLQPGMADRLGAVFGLTGSGIRSRYEALVAAERAGEMNYNGAFLDTEKSCLELLMALHPDHTLIQRAGLESLWNVGKEPLSS
jgi:hypothetical protein